MSKKEKQKYIKIVQILIEVSKCDLFWNECMTNEAQFNSAISAYEWNPFRSCQLDNEKKTRHIMTILSHSLEHQRGICDLTMSILVTTSHIVAKFTNVLLIRTFGWEHDHMLQNWFQFASKCPRARALKYPNEHNECCIVIIIIIILI